MGKGSNRVFLLDLLLFEIKTNGSNSQKEGFVPDSGVPREATGGKVILILCNICVMCVCVPWHFILAFSVFGALTQGASGLPI